MFLKKKLTKNLRLPPYAEYVSKKIAPNFSVQADKIVSTAEKSFSQGVGVRAVERALVDYGYATSQMISMSLAKSIQNVCGEEISDIQYGDCALTAAFIMRIPFIREKNALEEIIEYWIASFCLDIQYLIFSSDVSIKDLVDEGNERFLDYEKNGDSLLPDAYLHLLSQITRQRITGEWEPYKLLDPLGADPILFGAFQAAWPESENLVNHWISTAIEIQKIAKNNDLEVWEWW